MRYRVKRGWIFYYQDPVTEETYTNSITVFFTPPFESLAEAETEYKAIDFHKGWKLESNWASKHEDSDTGRLPIYIVEFATITQVGNYNGIVYDAGTIAERRYDNNDGDDIEWEVEW